jgi:hypothetical protein
MSATPVGPRESLRNGLVRSNRFNNERISQRALGPLAPIQALKAWRE